MQRPVTESMTVYVIFWGITTVTATEECQHQHGGYDSLSQNGDLFSFCVDEHTTVRTRFKFKQVSFRLFSFTPSLIIRPTPLFTITSLFEAGLSPSNKMWPHVYRAWSWARMERSACLVCSKGCWVTESTPLQTGWASCCCSAGFCVLSGLLCVCGVGLSMCLFLEDGGAVCVMKTHFVTGCIHSWEVKLLWRQPWTICTSNSWRRETKLDMVVWRLMVSEDGDVTWSEDVSWWSHRSLKPAEDSDKLVTLDFSSCVYRVHSPTSISQSGVWKQITLHNWNLRQQKTLYSLSGVFSGNLSAVVSSSVKNRTLKRFKWRPSLEWLLLWTLTFESITPLSTDYYLCWLPLMSVCLEDGGVKGWRVDRSELKEPPIVLTVEMKTR